MAVGVVAGDSILQPKNIGHAEIFAEALREILFGEAGLSFLHSAAHTFSTWCEQEVRARCFGRGDRRVRVAANGGEFGQRPMESAQISGANRLARGASRARWLRGVPTRRACESRERAAFCSTAAVS